MSIQVIYYAEDGQAPALQWILKQSPKVRSKLLVLIEMLESEGPALRRPDSAILRDKIFELRVRHLRTNYRLLYFFHAKSVAILAHGCTKQDVVDSADIDRAVDRRRRFLGDPDAHTHRE